MTPTIRNMTDSDAPAVAALLEQLGYPSTVDQVVSRLARIADERGQHVLVAEIGDRVVGLTTLFVRHLISSDAPLARIAALVVDSAWRSRGIGAALVAAAEALARAAGCDRIEVTSGAQRTRTHTFYLRLGYEDRPRRFTKHLGPTSPRT